MAEKKKLPANAQLITNPTTKPPNPNKPYIPVLVDGKEVWFEVSEDGQDGITARDFDFGRGQAWADSQPDED